MAKTKKTREFSKTLLIQESALMWVHTIAHILLAFYCIYKGFGGSLPWLTASASLPWAAYGVSQVYYYKKSLVENSKGGVKYESVLAELEKAAAKAQGTYTEKPYVDESYYEAPYANYDNTSSDTDLDYGI